MGMTFSCPGADSTLDKSFDALFMRSISFHGDDAKEATCSSSFNGRDSEPSILKALGSGRMIIKASLSFKRRDSDPIQMETEFSIRTSDPENESSMEATSSQNLKTEIVVDDIPRSPVLESCSPKHEAAVKLQKVYKSFRTRRQLADCAVLAEQTWWKLLDFALLKRSSVSFFGIEKPESVVSRWSRARTKAAKVGKGLSKDEKAQKLALQHWLEAIDPRHRYGHNLHFYYVRWLHCESQQPFFYWLDVGDGKEVNLEQHCPRWKLQQQSIKYLGPKEREAYEVIVENGKLVYKQSQQFVDTSEGPKDSKWIFVLSTSKSLYVGLKKKGSFQHSSFLAGGATSAAGRLVVENGILKAVWPHSGHYRPTEENFQELVSFLNEKNVDLTDVKRSPTDEDEESESRHTAGLRNSSSDNDLTKGTMTENTCAMFEDDVQQQQPASLGEKDISAEPSGTHSYEMSTGQSDCMSFAVSQSVCNLRAKNQPAFNRVYSQCVQDLFREFEGDSEEEADNKSDRMAETRTNEFEPTGELSSSTSSTESQPDGWETAEKPVNSEQHYIYHKRNLFEEDQDVSGEPAIPQEMILRRMNSKKGMISYQLGKQLSFKWTTGAGPRIGCVRDYPSELQFHALEQVNLSPRSARTTAKAFASPRYASPSPRSCAVTLKESSSGSSRNDLQVL